MKTVNEEMTYARWTGLLVFAFATVLIGCGDTDSQIKHQTPIASDHAGHDHQEHDEQSHEADDHSTHEGHDDVEHDDHGHEGHEHGEEHADEDGHSHDGHDHGDQEDASHAAQTLAVSPAVRRNLGITFAAAERRAVTQTVRVPGQFELLPSARRDYHAPVAGRIELYVEQYAEVKAGQLLATIDSPDWREQQAMVTQAASAVLTTEAAVTIAEVTLHEQEQQIRLLEERVDRLASAEVRRVELNNDLKQARLVLPRLEAELQAARVQVSEVKAQRRAHLQTASSKTGLSVERLSEVVGQQDGEPMERWQQLDAVPIAAISDGVVDLLAVTSGRWVETGDEIVVTIQPDRLRFHADTLLADATSLRSGLPARVVPPSGQGIQISESGVGELFVGPTAHTDERTISLYTVPEKMPGWAKAGVPGFIEVVRNPDTPTALAIPRSALVQDGLDFVFFRRLPGWPDEVQRVVADTGESDGRWIEISSGLNEGDEVVVDGVYQLLAASSTTLEEGGHFHSDGTFHEGEDE